VAIRATSHMGDAPRHHGSSSRIAGRKDIQVDDDSMPVRPPISRRQRSSCKHRKPCPRAVGLNDEKRAAAAFGRTIRGRVFRAAKFASSTSPPARLLPPPRRPTPPPRNWTRAFATPRLLLGAAAGHDSSMRGRARCQLTEPLRLEELFGVANSKNWSEHGGQDPTTGWQIDGTRGD